jgi:hypothetical protein
MRALFKRRVLRSQALRDSAKGEICTVQSPVCNHNPQTTVLAHLPDDSGIGKMGGKSDDWCAALACSACHAWLDQYADPLARPFYVHRAMLRTWRRWIELGLVTIKGVV